MKNLWRIVWWGKERHRTSKICYNYWQQHLPCWSEGAPLPVVMTGGASPGKLYHRAGNDPPEGYTLKATQPLFSFSLFWGQRRCDRPAWVPWAKICAQLMNLLKFIQICFDYTKAFNCVDHKKLWKILQEMGIPEHLTCLLRNLYAGQESMVRTGDGTTDWFQIGKGVRQGCILSLCLFNLYAT